MARINNLDDLKNVDKCNRFDFYRALTGEDVQPQLICTVVPPLNATVRRDNIDQVMDAVRKLTSFYRQDYYSYSVDEIKRAYENKDYAAFRQGVVQLLCTINSD